MGITMPREDTPYYGQARAVLPSHFDTGGTALLKTGKDNPLPTVIYGPDGSIISSTNRLPVDAQLSGSNSINANIATVTTAGTSVQLPNIPCSEITLIGLTANTGNIFVGGSNVSSTVYGVELAAKDSITIKVSNANLIYIDSSVNGEGVSYVAV